MALIIKGTWKAIALSILITASAAFGVLLARYGVHVISFAS